MNVPCNNRTKFEVKLKLLTYLRMQLILSDMSKVRLGIREFFEAYLKSLHLP